MKCEHGDRVHWFEIDVECRIDDMSVYFYHGTVQGIKTGSFGTHYTVWPEGGGIPRGISEDDVFPDAQQALAAAKKRLEFYKGKVNLRINELIKKCE